MGVVSLGVKLLIGLLLVLFSSHALLQVDDISGMIFYGGVMLLIGILFLNFFVGFAWQFTKLKAPRRY